MSHDDSIVDFLNRREPAEADAYLEAGARAIMDAMPAAYRRLSRFKDRIDLDEVISKAAETALQRLRKQWRNEKDNNFVFDPSVSTFEQWFLSIVGYPGRHERSGAAGTEFNRTCRAESRHVAIHEIDAIRDFSSATDSEDIESLKDAISTLSARPQFLIRAEYGIHDVGDLDSNGILKLATATQLGKPTPPILRQRADSLFSGDRKPSPRLAQKDIGHLLEISDRWVRTIKASAISVLREKLDSAG